MKRREANDHVDGHQPYEERIRPVVLFTIWLAVGTVAVLGLMKLAHDAFERQAREGSKPVRPLAPLATAHEEPPEPRLQATPSLDLQRFRALEGERLSTYGWVDRQAGIVHVPIERAMELVSKEGFPVRKQGGH